MSLFEPDKTHHLHQGTKQIPLIYPPPWVKLAVPAAPRGQTGDSRMTVFESANLVVQQVALALQKDTLELQQASLALQQASLAVQRASVWVAALVGAAQCAVAGHGLFLLHRYYKRSAEQHEKNMEAIEGRRKSQSEQHRETMKVLEGQNKALDNQQTAMMELIRRTSAQRDG